ncbi:MAG TPA: bifunctional phosphoribosylaminoimidazolecarboxamide formyltransferase/IMP cyclohydrolase [Myxococcales bacterium]
MNVAIKRALLSVSDKTGVVGLAKALHAQGCELISTGGTRKELEGAGLPVTEIGKVTGNPEAFGGRMKTISFAIESALLFDRERDAEEAKKLGIQAIDLVVCNLYPFKKHRDAGADLPTLVENIDIGGPTMIRAAAKNWRWVAVATDPSQYQALIQELSARAGALAEETRGVLMRAAFRLTADYDAMVATALDERHGLRSLRLAYDQPVELRYGENPHQKAAFLRERGAEVSLHDLKFHGGKELSYNNLVDAWAALEIALSLDRARAGCAIVKHSNPCGLAEAATQREALELAWAGDPVSSFGSVIAFNGKLGRDAVKFFELGHEDKSRRKFVEVVLAPAFEPEAIEALKQSKNLRIVEVDPRLAVRQELRFLPGALLAQAPDSDVDLVDRVDVVTKRRPVEHPRGLLDFGLKAVRQLKSNAIAIVRVTPSGAFQLLGMGAGQPNRVNSTRLAVERARANLALEKPGSEEYLREQLEKAVLVSDAFFPFPDNVEIFAAAGIRTAYQPGGSIKDKDVIAKCDELGVAMALTGRRHFKH